MPLPTLRQLRTFLAVVDEGSVSLAARALGLTQPAASQQLRELERNLGVRLLDRAAGRSLPTAAGTAFAAPARRAVAAAEEAAGAARAHREGHAGRVRIGTGATACIHLLPPLLAALKRRLPGLEVVVVTGNSDDMVRRLEEGALDCALVTLPLARNRALQVTPLLDDPLVALLPEGMAGQGDKVRPAELAALPLILYEAGGRTRGLIDAWFEKAGASPQPAMELGSVEAIKGLVSNGLGASVLPLLAAGRAVPGAVVRPLEPMLRRRLGLVLRREKVLDRGLRALVEVLEELKGKRPGE
ncbi:LysR family transcriptional regulator [Roseomonas sp. M0104]|uniref:LysR family transcriptional regulator n=1 Tax=Teichococcus coralli TaxID=2545983 RepID=A0A845BHR0_9PROT|nr:LysR family transcriptional regulator [Pseudoroseomonas coralli]MXP64847.1 LysR family transcriptional regulator [Pseudoroseomonas coralli]